MANIAFMTGEMATVCIRESEREKHAYNGRKEPFLLLQLLANNNPQNTYYVMRMTGHMDKYTDEQYEKDFPNKNVKFIINEFFAPLRGKKLKGMGTGGDTMDPEFKEYMDRFVDYLMNEVKIEYGISFCTFNQQGVPGVTRKLRDPHDFSKTLMSGTFSMYAIYFLNKAKIPYISYAVDMRFIKPNSTTLTVPPKAIVCFETGEMEMNYIRDTSIESYAKRDLVTYKVPLIYAGTDTLMMTSKDGLGFNIEDKTDSTLTLYFNQVKGSPFDRVQFLKDFGIIDGFKNIDLKLKLYCNIDTDHPLYDEKIMSPSLPHNEYFESMKKQKYTLIIPTYQGITNTSAKPWENIHMGVVPFMTPSFGSEEWREVHNLPTFLWVNDVDELKKKIRYLEANPAIYKELIDILTDKMTNGIYDGTFLNNELQKLFDKYCK